ncbi:hypothetical protein DPMN_022192 [Dreissena polymorpha]|uniref:Uncharacterized protein n=1 Tax=Dreissena polymorpha TaxID=45954 RepID=A0A9D4NN89_DREPO|nr:hypothetical protein DPMN_044132 [Dreissena polymorpha]KAH3897996.1 hypothetical protein DPMN_022192 [Dreissena polymorpha]
MLSANAPNAPPLATGMDHQLTWSCGILQPQLTSPLDVDSSSHLVTWLSGEKT